MHHTFPNAWNGGSAYGPFHAADALSNLSLGPLLRT